jgi:penicillin amidase
MLLALSLLALAQPLASAPESAPVHTGGLHAPVSVVTDRWGIPHLRAASLDDLYFAWGWVSARDRLWQMVYTRAGVDGQVHRWVGNSALQADGGAQLFRLRERAHAIWQRDRADTALRTQLERYAAGVNAYLNECRAGTRAWPAELVRLNEKPRDWTAEDCVAVVLGFGVTLDLDLAELGEAKAVADSGAAWYVNHRRYEDRWAYDTVPDSAAARMWHATAASGGAPHSSLHPEFSPQLLAASAGVLRAFPPRDGDGADRASNEFVVGGKRAAGGKPVLANDPHLGLATPGAFHVVHVSVPGVLDAIGADVPGLPVIVSGRNTTAAWGVTALSADVIDVYADTLSADGKRVRVHGADGRADWAPVETRPFDLHYQVLGLSIPVPPFVNQRHYTPHGPVLVWDAKKRLALSARWTALEDARITVKRLIGLERSVTAAEVCERTATLVTPCLNVVTADVTGDARFQSTGLLPIRAREPGPGPIPSNGLYEWTGFVPSEAMPHWRVPPAGYAVNANNRPVGGAYPYPLPRYDWPHDRARRMAQRLDGDKSITLEDAESVQNDSYSLAAERNVRHLLECADTLANVLPPRSKNALQLLHEWDFYARRGRIAPTLYRAWFGAFQRRSHLEGFPGLTLAALMSRAPETLVKPGSAAELETPAEAACAALAMALDTLTAKLGPDMKTWTYGRAHQARFRHALSALDSRARWEPPLLPEDGDNATPSVGPSRLPWSIEVTHGPAFRHVVDLAQPDVSFGVVPPYNSAAFTPSGARDLRGPWADHRYVPFLMNWDSIGAAAMETVTLQP